MKKEHIENEQKTNDNKDKNIKDTFVDSSKSSKKSSSKNKYDWQSTLIAIVVVLIVVGVVVFFVYKGLNPASPEGNLPSEYNGFDFIRNTEGYWTTTINSINGDVQMPFYYHPKQLETRRYDMRINQRLAEVQKNKGVIIISFSPEFANPELDGKGTPAIAGFEIQKVTSNILGMKTQGAFMSDIEGANLTVANCTSHSSPKVFVIEMKLGDSNRIYSENYCAIIQVTQLNETIPLADLLVFKLSGILPPTNV